ncbi:ROK family protein [Mycobacterium sp.]|uniref:ROK family protein n=1 Tax=Mycobacterium sp. TaxID=1785 RepID=UPI002C80AD30|nr:ROK family protein [Mycobacterium sp.]HME49651.1 ROK family protein [Mycobacterium sp.]
MTDRTLVLDIGGTKIAAGLVDPDGTLSHAAKRPTPRGDAETVWSAVDALISEAVAAAGGAVSGAGISSAGPIEVREGTVSPINITGWEHFPIVDRVAAAVPGVPVRLGGDGLCMTLGERWRGAARGADFVLGMVVSTGIGGGLVLDGVPYHGRTGNAGHVGHVVVEPDGEPCSCGGRGCVETVASGPRMTRWAVRHGWAGPAGADARELADAANAGDMSALSAFRRGGTAVAAMIASVAAVCDLDLVVIGGGVARSGPLLFDPLRDALAGYAGLEFIRGLRVVPAELDANAGLVGAGALANIEYA